MAGANKQLLKVITANPTYEGEGFMVHRPFPAPGLSYFDPFLLLDEMGPSRHAPGEAKGASDHPHRGFETVTYLLEGEMEHRDSQGNHGRLKPGDVQWMTAGAGVVHSEMPSSEFQSKGGTMHGFQLWVNLPASLKMSAPRYQELKASSIPEAASSDGKSHVRVIAGEFGGVSSPASTHVPILYLDVRIDQNGVLQVPVPSGYNSMVYVIEGELKLSDVQKATAHQLALFHPEGESLELRASGSARLLVLAGQPIQEPVARYGPFVMNTREELSQAVEDFKNGRMGKIAAEVLNI